MLIRGCGVQLVGKLLRMSALSSSAVAAERHASLRAVCDESWAMLSAEERRVFPRLALFHAGFGAAAASAVAGASVAVLDELIGKSLLRRVSGERYQIHELLRQYGLG
jgi:predicted ATPase